MSARKSFTAQSCLMIVVPFRRRMVICGGVVVVSTFITFPTCFGEYGMYTISPIFGLV